MKSNLFTIKQCSYKKVPKALLFNKSILPQQLSNDEKTKRQFYIQKANDEVI